MRLRCVDSGLRAPRANLSVTEALRRRRARGLSPDTLRLQHFPESAIIGRHQILANEVDLDWCAAHGVATARRMTGGGAIVMGPGLLGWELILSRDLVPASLEATSALLCEAIAHGLRRLGVGAAYRPRNDIECEGRKICGTGGYFDGPTVVFQGTLLIELDLEFMTRALRLPAAKLGKRGLEAFSQRVVDLKTLLGAAPATAAIETALGDSLGAALGLTPRAAALDQEEEALATAIHDAEIGTQAFVAGRDDLFAAPGRILSHVATTPGGTLAVALKLRDGAGETIEQAMIAGDVFVAPPRALADLEAHLRHRPIAAAAQAAQDFLDKRGVTFLGLTREDMVAALAATAEKGWAG